VRFLIGRLDCVSPSRDAAIRAEETDVFRTRTSNRAIREVLGDRAGAGIAEGIAGVALVLIIAATVGVSLTTDMGAVSTIATKAERQKLVTSLVGNTHEGATWGSVDAPTTEEVTLANGHKITVTAWREVTPTSVRLTATAPISADTDAADCSGPSAEAKRGCIYASRLHADDLDSIEPHAIIRKDASMGTAAPIGTFVDARVSTTDSIPQGAPIATGQDDTATVWRYLVNARSLDAGGEIRITQSGKVLALFPVDATDNNYFGTFTAALNVPVTATVTSGNVVVNTVFIYRAGSTS